MSPTYAPSAVGLPAIEGPGAVNYHHDIRPDGSPGERAVKDVLAKAQADADKFNARRAMTDETMTEAANLAQISKAADQLASQTLAGYDRAKSAIEASIIDAQRALDQAVALKPSPNASEIRSVLRSMTPQARVQEATKAFDARDREIISAIVGANPMLHGLDAGLVGKLYDAFVLRVAPAEVANLAEHKKAQRYLLQARPSLMAWMTRMHEGTRSHAQRKATFDAVIESYGLAG